MISKIIALVSIIIAEMIVGAIVSVIPDSISSETMKQLTNDPHFSLTYGQVESWFSIAQKQNESTHFWKSLVQLFLLVIAPVITAGVFVKKIL
jgi:hypothetical protein